MNSDWNLDREYTPIEAVVPEIVTPAEIVRLKKVVQAAEALSRRMVELSDVMSEDWKWHASIAFGEELMKLNRALGEYESHREF